MTAKLVDISRHLNNY